MKQFKVPGFLHASNIYSVNIRQFTEEGTITAFMHHLPRLKDMGVEILWLMPVYPIGTVNKKGTLGSYYSIKDFREINPEFGNKQDLHDLVKQAHMLDMKVILDWVANHAAWDNKWTITNPEFFKRDSNGAFLSPYDWTDVIQIDHTNEDQQNAMIAAMRYWVEEHDIDGFRADLAHLTPLPFWLKARKELSDVKDNLIWLAETEEPDYEQAFDINFTWEWMHATEEVIKGQKDRSLLHQVLASSEQKFRNSIRMYFTSNHDENSWNGTEYEKYNGYAQGLAVFSCTFPGIPLIYTGQELPNLKRLAFFEKDHIVWTDHPRLHDFYKTLLGFRYREPLFSQRDAACKMLLTEQPLIAFERYTADTSIVVIINLSLGEIEVSPQCTHPGRYTELFTQKLFILDNEKPVKIPGAGYLVLKSIDKKSPD